ncbi:hypothetical protein CR513_10117, partial [Mucuna pruriens]
MLINVNKLFIWISNSFIICLDEATFNFYYNNLCVKNLEILFQRRDELMYGMQTNIDHNSFLQAMNETRAKACYYHVHVFDQQDKQLLLVEMCIQCKGCLRENQCLALHRPCSHVIIACAQVHHDYMLYVIPMYILQMSSTCATKFPTLIIDHNMINHSYVKIQI